MKQILFFAAGTDLIKVFDAVEQAAALTYVRIGRGVSPRFDSFDAGSTIPALGIADAESGVVCATFLVAERTTNLRVRQLSQNGISDYFMDQLINPDTVTITPGGVWNNAVVLYGRIATASDTAIAQALMKRFHSAIRRQFTRVKAYWVGPEALALLQAGRRLTIAVQSPTDFDLRSE